MTKIEEIFLPIQGYEGFYEISNLGRIKSTERVDCKGQLRKELFIRPSFDKNGYLVSSISKNKVKENIRWHRVVALSFIANPHQKTEVNHINGVKWDNRAENLEWATVQENVTHAEEINLRHTKGVGNAAAKLTEENVVEIYNSNKSTKELAIEYQIGSLQIARIKNGYNWGHLTGHVYRSKKASPLTYDQVLKVFHSDGSHLEIGASYGVKAYVVANIKRGLTYSHITGKKHEPK